MKEWSITPPIMSYEDRDTYGIYQGRLNKDGPGPQLMGADTLLGNDVYNTKDEDLGDIKEIMLDMASGRVALRCTVFRRNSDSWRKTVCSTVGSVKAG